MVHNALDTEDVLLQEVDGLIRCRVMNKGIESWIFGSGNCREELQQIRSQVAGIPPETALLILNGNSIGYVLAQVIPQFLRNPDLRILIHEPVSARLYACLAMIDLRAALGTGRLHFFIGESGIPSIIESFKKWNLFGFQPFYILNAPEATFPIDREQFVQVYDQEFRKHEEQQKTLSIRLENRRKEINSTKKIERIFLIDCWPGAPGEAHLKAIQNALHRRGMQTEYVVLNRYQIDGFEKEYRRMIQPGIQATLDRFHPDVVISYGYHAPKFLDQEWFDRSGAVWVQSVSNIAYYDTRYYSGERTVLIEDNLIPYFKKRGAHHPFFVPIMADYVSAQPVQTSRQIPIIFIGNCLGLAPKAAGEFITRWQGRDSLVNYIKQAEGVLGDFNSKTNLYDYLRENPMPQIAGEEEEYAVFRYLLCQGSAARRRKLLEKIVLLGLQLFGGDWPAYLPPDSPLHACFRGYLPLEEEAKAFHAGHIFVNIHSVGHVTGPNMRFFNVPGMGGFQISDGPLFSRYLQPDSEAVFFATEEEFVEKVLYYRNHYKEAEEIRCQGHLRIKKDWTYDRWVEMVFGQL